MTLRHADPPRGGSIRIADIHGHACPLGFSFRLERQCMTKVEFVWERFANVQDAPKKFKSIAGLYMLTYKEGRILGIGESGNLRNLYRGGTGWMVEAALHGSGNLVFIAAARIEEKIRKSAEVPPHLQVSAAVLSTNQLIAPVECLEIEHTGEFHQESSS